MKILSAIMALLLSIASLQANAAESPILPGDDVIKVKAAMTDYGYKETGLDMTTTKADTRLMWWSVGEGVLIIEISNRTKKVAGMSYHLSDERPKLTRKEFEFDVKSFDPQTREMKIVLPRKPLSK